MDEGVFGALKATVRHVFYVQYQENPEFQFSKQNAIESLFYAWENLSIDVIEDAWPIYVDEDYLVIFVINKSLVVPLFNYNMLYFIIITYILIEILTFAKMLKICICEK